MRAMLLVPACRIFGGIVHAQLQPAHAAQKTNARNNDASIEQKCREMVGKEQYEGEGRGGVGRLQAQRFGECMIGMPH